MVDAREWADAFVAQASEDLVAAQAAFEAGAVSTFCRLIQMVFEKLAKAAFGRGGQSIARKHEVAARLMVVLRRNPGALSLIVGGDATLAAVRECAGLSWTAAQNESEHQHAPPSGRVSECSPRPLAERSLPEGFELCRGAAPALRVVHG